MTLFEAIRQLKEGQAAVIRFPGNRQDVVVEWPWGCSICEGEDAHKIGLTDGYRYSIIDLPKPKITLEEGLRTTLGHAVVYTWGIPDILKKLYSLPIDWQAEADRAKKDSA